MIGVFILLAFKPVTVMILLYFKYININLELLNFTLLMHLLSYYQAYFLCHFFAIQ